MRYKSRKKLKIGNITYLRTLSQRDVIYWYEIVNNKPVMIRDGTLFDRLEKRFHEKL